MTGFKMLLCPFGFLVLVLSHTHQAVAQSSRTANNRMERRARFSTPPVPVAVQERAPETFGVHWFDQLIDHKKKRLGTFKQRYWLSGQTYYPEGPILLASGDDGDGEDSLEFIKKNGLMGRFARGMLGASVVLEHRYFGKSIPYEDYSEENLKYLTIKQSVEDLVYFAKTVNLEMPGGKEVHPTEVPWIIFGGGYTGALANWAMLRAPDIFFAGYASSPTVQALENYWEFWDFLRQNMPQNCSADVQAVSSYIDKVATGNKAQHRRLIKELGLQKVNGLADAAASIPAALRTRQYLQPGQEGFIFSEFCDTLEFLFEDPPPAEGRGLEYALYSIRRWNEEEYGLAGLDTDDYWGTQMNPRYTDLSTNGTQDRPQAWLRCNELGWFRTGAPRGLPSLVPRILNVERERGICAMYFPDTYKPSASRIRRTNSAFGGWKKRAKRLYVTDGANNAWTGVTFAAPGAQKYNKGMLKVQISKHGFHMSDLWTNDKAVDDLRVNGYNVIMGWLNDEWEAKKGSKWKSWKSKILQKLRS